MTVLQYDFDHLGIGINSIHGIFDPKPVRIGDRNDTDHVPNNSFTNCSWGIRHNSVTDAYIESNEFDNVPFGIDNRGPGHLNIENNDFISTSINAIAIQNTNASAQIQAHCNNYSYANIGINAFQNNPFFNFVEEEFNLDENNRDVAVHGNSNAFGSIQPVLGTEDIGLVNIFSNQLADFAVDQDYTATHTYYAEKPVANLFGTRWVPRCPITQSPTYDTECTDYYNYKRFVITNDSIYTQCLDGSLAPYPDGCRWISCLEDAIDDVNNYIVRDTGYIRSGTYWDLYIFKETTYHTVYLRLLKEEKYDSIAYILALEATPQNIDRAIDVEIHQGNHSTARSLVNDLPTDTRDEIDQFVLWNIEIDKAEADTLFEYNSFYIEFLKDLAYDNRLMTPKAQAILYQLYDTVFEPIQPVDMRSNKTRHIPVTLAEPVKIYPNPACNSINIELNLPDPILNGMYKIYDILGIEKLSGKIMSTNTNLDINGLFSGSYFLNLNYNGKSSFQRFSVIK